MPNPNARNENISSKQFFHNRHFKTPKWLSQHEIVSTTAGILMPRIEKNIAPTREINGSNSGTATATTTAKIREIRMVTFVSDIKIDSYIKHAREINFKLSTNATDRFNDFYYIVHNYSRKKKISKRINTHVFQ